MYREYNDAIVYARLCKFKSSKEWIACETHPPDIPKQPDIHYSDRWTGWRHFLGKHRNKAYVKAETAQLSSDFILFCNVTGLPSNLIEITSYPTLDHVYKALQQENHIHPLKLFRSPKGTNYIGMVGMYGTNTEGNQWIFPNINEMFFNLLLEEIYLVSS